jgi:hypothetical protein
VVFPAIFDIAEAAEAHAIIPLMPLAGEVVIVESAAHPSPEVYLKAVQGSPVWAQIGARRRVQPSKTTTPKDERNICRIFAKNTQSNDKR